jgi:hypothetical protein
MRGNIVVAILVAVLGMISGALVTWALTARHYQAKLDYLYARNRALQIRASRGN